MDKEKKVAEAKEALGIDENLTQEEEFDYVAGFLKAAEVFEKKEKTIEIRRDGELHFRFNVHPYSTKDVEAAKKKGTTYVKNPKGPKYPAIAKGYSSEDAESYLIYLSTCDADRAKLWDNPKFKERFNVMEGYQLIDKVLLPAEKQNIIQVLDSLGGFDDDEEQQETNDIDVAKNS